MKIPELLQMSQVECGAACLAMVLNYYGRKVSVADCRELCLPGRDGITAYTIAEAARRSGLRVRAFSAEPSNLKKIKLPAILHWTFNHFIVLEHWSPNNVKVIDPSVGRRTLTKEEFNNGFTGVVITVEPGENFSVERSEGKEPAWRSYLQQILRLPGVPWILVQILITSFLLQLLGLALPLAMKLIVDSVIPYQLTQLMPILGIGMILMVLTQMVTYYLRQMLSVYLKGQADSQIMLAFFEHTLNLPLSFFQQRANGDMLMRLNSNLLVRELLTSQILSAILDGFFVLIYLIILLANNLLFGILVLALSLVQILLLIGTRTCVHELNQRALIAQANTQGYMVEALNGFTTLKASGAEQRVFDYWTNLFFTELNLSLKGSQLTAIIDTLITAFRTFSPLILLWIGTLQVLNGTMSLGTMLALNGLAISFLIPFSSLAVNGQSLQLIGAHLDRVADVLNAQPEQNLMNTHAANLFSGRIELEGVGFRYHPEGAWTLQDISIMIEPGSKVAIVGRTGSGKSTLAMLLLGFLAPTRGKILIDNISIQTLDLQSLRNQFGVVLQEPFLFGGTIRQNIAFNDPNLSYEQITEAAKLAAIHEDIMQMPMGYETRLVEGGKAISGGERQRLAIARAIAHKPTILLLDEATSHLDVSTEAVIDRNISSLACTRIVIAHRLSTVQNADLILVLKDGVIVEKGRHDELIEKNGVYAELVQNQILDDIARAKHCECSGKIRRTVYRYDSEL